MSMSSIVRSVAIACLVAVALPASISARQQGQQGQQQGQAPPNLVPDQSIRLVLKLVVEKLDKDKVISSLPFELTARPRGQATLNHGKSVAVPQTTTMRDGTTTTSYAYQSIGSNIAITNVATTDRLVTFELMLDISAIDPTTNPAVPSSHVFRKVSMQSTVAVRPGEPTVVTVSNDQISGETVRLVVTATLVK